jgi:hypothetical protein
MSSGFCWFQIFGTRGEAEGHRFGCRLGVLGYSELDQTTGAAIRADCLGTRRRCDNNRWLGVNIPGFDRVGGCHVGSLRVPPFCSQMKPRPFPTIACAEIGPSTSSTAQHVLSSLRHVGTRFGDLAILNRGCARDTDGSDNLAIHDEGNTTLQRRSSAEREYAHTDAALRH